MMSENILIMSVGFFVQVYILEILHVGSVIFSHKVEDLSGSRLEYLEISDNVCYTSQKL